MSSVITSHPAPNIFIRTMEGPADFQRAEQVQRETWGYHDLDIVPSAIFSVARNFGGQALCAMDGERMVGYALSLGSAGTEHVHFHSHMVAVIPEYQNKGLGLLIKIAQRKDALERGVDQIAWTFDPLKVKNAYFNLVRLGGVGVRYLPNLYGTTSSPLHGGIPTDRLLIEWNLTSPHVERALSGVKPMHTEGEVAVEIPASANSEEREARLAGQLQLRTELMDLMRKGYVITGFEGAENKARYILTKNENDAGEAR